MQTSGIKIDINSKNLLIENSEKIEKVIKFAVQEAIKKKIENQVENFKKNQLNKTLCQAFQGNQSTYEKQ